MSAVPLELSIVSPVYKAEGTVAELVRRIAEAAAKITPAFEIILVDDRSPDGSWQAICEAAKVCPQLKGARLSRNFGQHGAISAALSLASGRRVVVMDCDLQHDPAELERLWAKADEGFDIVLAHHSKRQHAAHRNIGASLFRLVNTIVSGSDQAATGLGTYSLLSRPVVDAYLQFKEVHRHYLHIIRWLGFRVGMVEVDHHERFEGTSSYTFGKLVRHAIDGILGQSRRLLHFAVAMGICYCIAAFLGVVYVVLRWALWGSQEGWASMVVLILASTGSIVLTLGILGIYIGGIFDQVRSRPIFMVAETTQQDPDASH